MRKNEKPKPKKRIGVMELLIGIICLGMLSGCINYMPQCETGCSQALPSGNVYGGSN